MKNLKGIALLFAFAGWGMIVHGCGGGASDPSSVAIKPSQAGGSGADGGNGTGNTAGGNGSGNATPSGGYGTFKGRMVMTGTPPTFPVLIRQGATVKDGAVCAVSDIPDEKLVTSDGGVASVFVYLRRAPRGGKDIAAHEPTSQQLFDQKQCTFIPHAMVLRVGKPVLVKSSDSVPHNVKTNPQQNDPFNATLDKSSIDGVQLTYARSELVPCRVECNFHNWMRAWHLPLDHPYGVVTKADGSFEISDLPVGQHRFFIWHELAGRIESSYAVEIKSDGDVVDKTIEIDAGSFAAFKGPAPKRIKLSQLR